MIEIDFHVMFIGQGVMKLSGINNEMIRQFIVTPLIFNQSKTFLK